MTAPRGHDTPRSANALSGWTAVSLRPVGAHDGVRRAARARGAALLACSPLRLVACPENRDALRTALAAPLVVFTSPAAVQFAARLTALRPAAGARWHAVGAGTAHALAKAGVGDVSTPHRMDSEGLLELPALARIAGRRIGLVTAPGGRGLIADTLAARGATVLRADAYRRETVTLAGRRLASLAELPPARTALLVSSGEAFDAFCAQLTDALRQCLPAATVVASSARLADKAKGRGFERIALASSARPADLFAALTAYAVADTFG